MELWGTKTRTGRRITRMEQSVQGSLTAHRKGLDAPNKDRWRVWWFPDIFLFFCEKVLGQSFDPRTCLKSNKLNNSQLISTNNILNESFSLQLLISRQKLNKWTVKKMKISQKNIYLFFKKLLFLPTHMFDFNKCSLKWKIIIPSNNFSKKKS